MNKVIYNYIIKNYLKIVLNMTLVFFGVIILLNLFQEIEFFKDLNVGIQLPLTLTIMLAPNIIIKIFPFIIFFSAMWYLVSINNKELLTLKFFGISTKTFNSFEILFYWCNDTDNYKSIYIIND